MTHDITEQQQKDYIQTVNDKRKTLKQAITPKVLQILKDKFQTNLPCFQGTQGHYDPLDAMRRDAHREIILWIENEISKAQDNN